MSQLFTPVGPEEKLSPSFVAVRDTPTAVCARRTLDDAYENFEDVDGNFVQQFQTDAFDARLFELYLNATLLEQGFSLHRPKPHPDFIARKGGLRVAIEATTTNPSTSGAVFDFGKRIADIRTVEKHEEYSRNEFPVRLGSALYSKLKKKYWESPSCQGIPLIFALQAFHDRFSLGLSDYAIRRYLYGFDLERPIVVNGELRAESVSVTEHTVGPKSIPSGFFEQPDTEHVSAVLFTNQGTLPKFTRKGILGGCEKELLAIRFGFAADPEPASRDAAMFCYSVHNAPFVEQWSTGITLLHNPNALRPIARDSFTGISQVWMDHGRMEVSYVPEHIYNSTTVLVGGLASGRDFPSCRVSTVSPERAAVDVGFHPNPPLKVDAWFHSDPRDLMGALLRKGDKWTYTLLSRGADGRFAPRTMGKSYDAREDARCACQDEIMGLSKLLEGIAELTGTT